jgi:hypothetical protein
MRHVLIVLLVALGACASRPASRPGTDYAAAPTGQGTAVEAKFAGQLDICRR